MNCLFCKIVNNEIPSKKIYEDEDILAFLDINPDCNGHTLIIPKKHFKDIDDIDTTTLKNIYESALKVKKILEEKLHIDGLTFVQNNGEVQEIKHFHLHLKPYYNKNNKFNEIQDIQNIYEILKEN